MAMRRPSDRSERPVKPELPLALIWYFLQTLSVWDWKWPEISQCFYELAIKTYWHPGFHRNKLWHLHIPRWSYFQNTLFAIKEVSGCCQFCARLLTGSQSEHGTLHEDDRTEALHFQFISFEFSRWRGTTQSIAGDSQSNYLHNVTEFFKYICYMAFTFHSNFSQKNGKHMKVKYLQVEWRHQ